MRKRSSDEFAHLVNFLGSVKSFTGEDLIFLPKGALYHYTDLSGLQGILQTDDLWLTHSRYLNDDEEITHGYRIVREVIEEERKTATSDRIEFLDGLYPLVREPSAEGVYICSFCLVDNQLSQWRGYGANGTGVSLEFAGSGFSYVTGSDSPPDGLMRLWEVFYSEPTQKGIVKQAIDFAFNMADRSLDERTHQAAYAIQFFIPTFKNDGFQEEQECRLIFTPSPTFSLHPKFRVTRSMLIPYLTLKQLSNSTAPLPLTGVRVGPSANQDLNLESTRMVLAQKGRADIPINISNISFRG